MTQRGLTRTEAANYVGLSPRSFDDARKAGRYPNATLPGHRFDRMLLDRAMDRMSGIPTAQPTGTESADDQFAAWAQANRGN